MGFNTFSAVVYSVLYSVFIIILDDCWSDRKSQTFLSTHFLDTTLCNIWKHVPPLHAPEDKKPFSHSTPGYRYTVVLHEF